MRCWYSQARTRSHKQPRYKQHGAKLLFRRIRAGLVTKRARAELEWHLTSVNVHAKNRFPQPLEDPIASRVTHLMIYSRQISMQPSTIVNATELALALFVAWEAPMSVRSRRRAFGRTEVCERTES